MGGTAQLFLFDLNLDLSQFVSDRIFMISLPVHTPTQLANFLQPAVSDTQESQYYWEHRRLEAKTIEEAAWQIHHHQNRDSVNRYAMTRRVRRVEQNAMTRRFSCMIRNYPSCNGIQSYELNPQCNILLVS